MKLQDFLRLDGVEGLFGVEIEIEGENLPEDIPKEWRMEHDGSLRGQYPRQCAEYVFRKPLDPTKAKLTINKLIKYLEQEEARPNFSHRTSLHVHVNCQQLDWEQYSAFLYTSLLMERVMLQYCGKGRIGNRFCLRVSDAEGYADDLLTLFTKGFEFFALGGGAPYKVKYSAINIAPAREYGSLEFRGMRGTLDKAVIFNWLTALENVYNFALEKGSVEKVHKFFVNSAIEDFYKEVLGGVSDAFYYKGAYDDIRLCHSLLIDVAYNCYNKQAVPKDPVVEVNKINFDINQAQFNPLPAAPVIPDGWHPVREPVIRGPFVYNDELDL